VNFPDKDPREIIPTQPSRGLLSSSTDDSTTLEIEDEFGRTKRVKRDSQEYRNHCARQLLESSNQYTQQGERGRGGGGETQSEPWAWSRGGNETQEQQRYEHEIKSTKLYSKYIADGITAAGGLVHEDSRQRVTTMSAQSRVRSQWEKTLQGESREFLEEIHQQTQERRSSAAVANTEGSVVTTSGGGHRESCGCRSLDLIRSGRKEIDVEKETNRATETDRRGGAAYWSLIN
jgi:hypothetical protein